MFLYFKQDFKCAFSVQKHFVCPLFTNLQGWTNVSVTYSKEMLLFTTYVFTEMILHSSYFLLSYKVLFFKKCLFLLCENWWYFTIDLISQHTIIESFENRSETSSNMSSWFNVWFSSYFTLSILHVPPYIM